MNTQLGNYKAPPIVSGTNQSGRIYRWMDFEYREIQKLGQGRERECWRVRAGNVERAVLKSAFLARDEKIWIHFQKVIAHLDGHPNIVKTHTTFWTIMSNMNVFFIVQDCFTNCIVYLINQHFFNVNRVETHSVFLQLANGLDFAHGKGAILNDISLDNILYRVTPEGKVIVAYGDLGGVDLPGAPFPRIPGNNYYLSLTRFKDDTRSMSDDVSSLAICVAAIGWNYLEGLVDLPYEEYEKMSDPKDIDACFRNFKAKINDTPWKPLLLEMLAESREARPTAHDLLNRIKEIHP